MTTAMSFYLINVKTGETVQVLRCIDERLVSD